MSDHSARPEAAPGAVLTDEAARRISELAFRWLRPWDFLLGIPARDQEGNIVGWLHYRSLEDTAKLSAFVVHMANATLGAVLERWMPSEGSRARFIASIQAEAPERTPALRRLCEAAERAHRIVDALYGPPKDFPTLEVSWDQAREAWGELKAARLGLEEALSADPAPAAPIEAPAASRPKGEAASGKLDKEPIPVRAMAAAHALMREGEEISLRAVCERAGIDRANLKRRHPDTVATIQAMPKTDRAPRRGVRDRRTGDVDAWDSDADE